MAPSAPTVRDVPQQKQDGDVKLSPPMMPSSFDWFCETLQVIAGGAGPASAWAALNLPPERAAIVAAVLGAAAYIAVRYLKLCTPARQG